MVGVVALVLITGFLVANRVGGSDSPDSGQAAADERATPLTVTATRTRASTTSTVTPVAPGAQYDLQRDEERGGHTLSKHVGRTDDQLRSRLQSERDISAASTYTDRNVAEETVAAALSRNEGKVRDWVKGSSHVNLAIRVTMPSEVGRSLKRGASTTVNVKSAVVVLRWAGSDWYVLTSYPEDR
jgi:hypothetical protein